MITNLDFKDIITQLFLFLNIMNGKNILLLKILLVNSLYGFEKKVDNNVCIFATLHCENTQKPRYCCLFWHGVRILAAQNGPKV